MELTRQQILEVLSGIQDTIIEANDLRPDEDGIYTHEDIEEVQNTINLVIEYYE